MKTVRFPEDFKKIAHSVIPGATQWLYEYKDSKKNMISIVGGGVGLHGDGVHTFEMWDTKNMHDPEGYCTKEFIQQWLNDHPFYVV